MSVVKRILEANRFSKHLPPEWKAKELASWLQKAYDLSLTEPQIKVTEAIVHSLTKRQSKKIDENQLSLF